MTLSSVNLAEDIKEACDGIWDVSHSWGRDDIANPASPATKGDVLTLMTRLVEILEARGPFE